MLPKIFWSKPKIFIAKKMFNNKLLPCVEKGYKWYVYYYYLNPYNNKLQKFKETRGINRFKTVEDRTRSSKNLRNAVERFLLDYNPFEIKEKTILFNNLWSKPKIFIPNRYVNGKLQIDENEEWYVYYNFFNSNTNNLEFFKEKFIYQTENVSERIIALDTLRSSVEQKLVDGYNPFEEKKVFTMNEEEYIEYLKFKLAENSSKSYFSPLFKTTETENILSKCLKELNVIDKENKASKGFQSACNSFWIVSNYIKYRNVIYKPNISKKDFINHLNEKYYANISKKSRGTLSVAKSENNYLLEKLIKTYTHNIK